MKYLSKDHDVEHLRKVVFLEKEIVGADKIVYLKYPLPVITYYDKRSPKIMRWNCINPALGLGGDYGVGRTEQEAINEFCVAFADYIATNIVMQDKDKLPPASQEIQFYFKAFIKSVEEK